MSLFFLPVDFKPDEIALQTMFSRRLALKGLAFGALSLSLGACSSYVPEGNTRVASVTRQTAMQKINATRRAHGRQNLTYSSKLAKAATNHVRRMARAGELSHTLGGSLRERVREVGYIGAVGENLAGGQHTLEGAITGWLGSATHRGVLLSARFTEFGLAVTNGKAPYNTYWAAIFGGDSDAWVEARFTEQSQLGPKNQNFIA